MCEMMDEQIKRWTARRKLALAVEIIQGKTAVAVSTIARLLRRAGPHRPAGLEPALKELRIFRVKIDFLHGVACLQVPSASGRLV